MLMRTGTYSYLDVHLEFVEKLQSEAFPEGNIYHSKVEAHFPDRITFFRSWLMYEHRKGAREHRKRASCITQEQIYAGDGTSPIPHPYFILRLV